MDKNTIIKNGVYDVFLQEKRKLYLKGLEPNNKNNYLDLFDEDTIITCFKIYNANRARKRYGLEELIKWCFVIDKSNHYKNFNIVFGTLTFNDKVLSKTSKETRRQYVSRFLANTCESYIANIDYGNKNEREHYHFVALCSDEIKKDSWKYGYDSYRKIGHNKNELQKAKNYILKLNNHSYKSSTRNERVIMNKSKKGIDLIDIIVENNYTQFRPYKLQFLTN